MFAWQFAKSLYLADLRGWTRFVSMQNHYNLVYREEEREMLPLCWEEGLGIIPWSPLARGLLTGTRRRGEAGMPEGASARARSDDYAHRLYTSDSDFEIAERVVQVASDLGATPAQVALAWLLRQPAVAAPIVGASKVEHLEDAVKAVELELDDAACTYLEKPYRPHPVLGHG